MGTALLALVLFAPVALAQASDQPSAPAPAQAGSDDPYTATVTVDATSDDVAKARDIARLDGERRALTAVADRLAGGSGKASSLKLADNAITDLVQSFEVANERMTAVRYVADYTFHFRKSGVDDALRAAGIAIAHENNPAQSNPATVGAPTDNATSAGEPGGMPVVLLPVYQASGPAVLWDDPNPWREAWAQIPAGDGPVRLLVPLGDVSDIDAIDADKARAGDAKALSSIAEKYGGDDVVVAIAVLRTAGGQSDGLDVTARRYRLGQFVEVHADSIDGEPGAPDDDLFRRAAAKIAADIGAGWKDATPPGGDEQGSLTAVLPITSLDDWIKLRERLGTLPTIRKIDLKSLSRQEATLEINYVGDLDHLKASFADIGLDLIRGDPMWQLARSAAAKP